MTVLGQYILSAIIAAMICGIAVSLVPSEPGKAWIRLLCGLILTVAVIRPLSDVKNMDFQPIDPFFWEEGRDISAQGEKMIQSSLESIIKEKCEAYILDKANALGISVSAEVSLSSDQIPVPVSVLLRGSVSPYQKLQLESWIQEEFGITKENLRWKEWK